MAHFEEEPIAEQPLHAIVAGYYERVDAGETLDWRDLVLQHPQHAQQLEEFFRGHDKAKALAAPLRPRPATDATLPAPAVVSLACPDSFGDYEILGEIARGGMGIVYRARQISLNRPVALKMILAGTMASADDLRRFRNEAEAAARLDHPNIVPVYGIGEHAGRQFFSMRLIEGESLAVHLNGDWRAARRETQRLSASLMARVARAVHFAHERGVLHRDLKPGNILLTGKVDEVRGATTRMGFDPSAHSPHPESLIVPYVTDFGLAKWLERDSDLTRTGSVVGTPSYIAPEQAAAMKELTPAADIFSLGAILYHLLAGRKPFQGETAMAVLVEVQTLDPPRPTSLNPSLPRELEIICLKCLNKRPADRYRTAADLAHDLERWLAGLPIRACPLPVWRRWAAWPRRHVRSAVAASLVAVLGLGIALGTHWSPPTRFGDTPEKQAAWYIDRVASALIELEASRHESAARILDECPAELRRWEWHYLRRSAAGQPTIALRGHEGPVPLLRFDPTGKLLASGDDKTVRLWDTSRWEEVSWFRHQNRGSRGGLSFSPDGKYLAVADARPDVVLYRLTEPRAVTTLKVKDDGAVSAVSFSPDSRLIAACSGDHVVRILNHDSGNLRSVECPVQVFQVLFHPQKALLATACCDGSVGLLNLDDESFEKLDSGRRNTPSLAFDKDGILLASCGSEEDIVRVWNVATKETVHTLHDSDWPIWQVDFAPHEPRLAEKSMCKFVQIWDTTSGRSVAKLPVPDSVDSIAANFRAIAFSPDGHFLAVNQDKDILVWDGRPWP